MRHCLDGIDERYIIAAGTGQVEVGSLERQPVEAGDVVIIPAGVSQRITNTGQVDLIFFCVCTPPCQPSPYRWVE